VVVGKTLYDKLWERHHVVTDKNGISLLYIDRHLIHEITSPQAFEGLAVAGRKIWRKDSILAVVDHNIPTTDRHLGIKSVSDPLARLQIKTLDDNCQNNDIYQIKLTDNRQGIVHVIGPEQGATLPGMTIVCGDSHTATHGALACLAQGIGTSEVEHVLATQCLRQKKLKNMQINIDGHLPEGITAKDLILNVIGHIGTAGATGYAIEFSGTAIRELSIESRMTICNMAIEAGARVGLIAFDKITEQYVSGRPFAPQGELWQQAVSDWRQLCSDEDAKFDLVHHLSVENIKPQVSWGTSPEMVLPVNAPIPDPLLQVDANSVTAMEQMLDYMGLKKGQLMTEIPLDKIFIGSCTNGRIEDLRAAAKYLVNQQISKNIKLALVVPGSGLVKQQAENEGLDEIFIKAGFEWRDPGCSMCVAINDDKLLPEERCASTSNRNFEGRQGYQGRTHLVSPAMAAAAAVAGHFVDITARKS
jgi:3-isopropylmalate/(R)-2-methylmalate dehydratase large subunit